MSRTLPADHWARDEFPAADEATYSDSIVMQGHADYCAQYGHATVSAYYSDDVCGRCEEKRTPATPATTGTPDSTDDEYASDIEDFTPALYSIYSLTDGLAGEDESADTDVEAYAKYEAMVQREVALRDELSTYAETSVHLYMPHWGNMIAETTIPAKF